MNGLEAARSTPEVGKRRNTAFETHRWNHDRRESGSQMGRGCRGMFDAAGKSTYSSERPKVGRKANRDDLTIDGNPKLTFAFPASDRTRRLVRTDCQWVRAGEEIHVRRGRKRS